MKNDVLNLFQNIFLLWKYSHCMSFQSLVDIVELVHFIEGKIKWHQGGKKGGARSIIKIEKV